ncbi:MAG: hypothetical protein AAF411_12400 [Myxococcota bacterium]
MRLLLLGLFVFTACGDDGLGAVDAARDAPALDEGAVDEALPDAARDEALDAADASPADEGAELALDEGVDASDDAAPDDAAPESRCESSESQIVCPRMTRQIRDGVTALTNRDVHYQVPLGEAPPEGWPVVLIFQGSLFTAGLNWIGIRPGPFGAYYQAETLKRLLDAGYAVITPEARFEGATFWDTNVPPFSVAWETSGDHRLMERIFEAIENGDFGPLNADRMFATGISSGGYMTSRMAVSYPGRFTALAIHSAAYANCSGALCVVPNDLPSDHPPTLFLHGEDDLVVPAFTMERYRDALVEQGFTTDAVLDPDAAHEWIEAAPASILRWFDAYRD